MRRQPLIVILIAVFLGLIAVYLVNTYLTASDDAQDELAGGTTQIAVARIPLEFGMPVNSQNVRFVPWPANSVPPGSFSDVEQFNQGGVQQVVLQPIAPGEPVLASRLSGGRATLSALLPENMRAISIPITTVTGVSGFVLPGDRVDVMLTYSENDEQVTDVILQNVRVVAVDQLANDQTQQPVVSSTATLEVTREDAQKLSLARSVGTMSLALRSVRSDEEFVYASALRANELKSGAYNRPINYGSAETSAPARPARRVRRQRTPAPARPSTYDVEIIRGTAGTDYSVGQYRGN